ncbi:MULTISPECIES: HAD family hydrolase [Vibrio]|uniref:HAD family hydrolase n=1 Tax=Vibrio TaxID=662 RepID=UPI0001B95479|nr:MULTISPECIES: HAD family hydrolase [Vibrio]EEX32259.1 phosphoserine phosphatase [Vibrio coralliilyticus ATCC BAA-450]MCM5508233.1 HAD-IB family hydrolase [Vibrio sp. SCSIO 43169]MDE3897783.1 HAD-IB family hydrolase [Vibrio sp. CC007]QFT39441.1 haloacid dehalogenase-like hydrolase [Vibrio sp. THAF64]QGM36021.1 haloacid dehalogenase-like hydrolase [Vibrio sp. THAF191d]
MTKPLYVFDLDETLIKADSAMIWNEFLVEKGIVDDASFLTEDQRLMALYSQGKLDMDDYLKFAMAPIAHLSLGEVEKLVNECVDKGIAPKQFQQSIPLLEQLNKQGVDTLIISATVSFIVEAVARHLGVEQSMGIELVTEDDRYTAKVSGVPSYREGKVTRLEQWLSARDETYSEIHFYTDSINDLPLCERADYAYLVNPCPRLKAIADRPNWTILHWD